MGEQIKFHEFLQLFCSETLVFLSPP